MTYPEADDDIYANIYQKLINEIESWTSKTESGFRNTLNYNAIKTQITRPKVGQMINNFDQLPTINKFNKTGFTTAPSHSNHKVSSPQTERNYVASVVSQVSQRSKNSLNSLESTDKSTLTIQALKANKHGTKDKFMSPLLVGQELNLPIPKLKYVWETTKQSIISVVN
jgi:hypothetical protein